MKNVEFKVTILLILTLSIRLITGCDSKTQGTKSESEGSSNTDRFMFK